MAADPTYPLFPILYILGAFFIAAVSATNFIRQSWSLGMAFLCFWLFWDLLTRGINTIIWADNADIRLHVYCDIGSSFE